MSTSRISVLSFVSLLLIASVTSSCGSREQSVSQAASSTDSLFLVRAGDNAKRFFYQKIEEQNQAATSRGLGFRFDLIDARDPRLYGPGQPIQPPTPADLVLIKTWSNGAWRALAFVIDRPGYLLVKESPTGNFVIDIGYGAERIAYTSRFDGLFASVGRNTSGMGWNYVYYLRGQGNWVNPMQFDAAVATFLSNSVAYICNL